MDWSCLRRNWLGIVGVIGAITGIIGIALSIHFYSISRSIREPIFLEDPIRTEILTHERITQAPIKVFRSDGDEVTSDLISLRFYFWNAGNDPIHSDDLLRDLTIYLDNQDAKILDFRLLKTSRDVAGLALKRDPSDPNRSLILSFTILEYNDGATGQIIYEGASDCKLKIKGVIEGVKRFTLNTDLQPAKFWSEIGKRYLPFLVIILLTYWLGTTKYSSELIPKRLRSIWMRIYTHNLATVIKLGFMLFLLLILTIVLVLGIFIGPISQAKKDAGKNVVQNVPSQILPEK